MEPDQDMPFADVTLEPAVADSADGLGVLVLIRDVIVRPRAAMSRLVASPDRRWLFPIVALVIAAGVAAVTGLQVSSEYRDAVAREAVERQMQGRIESGEASEQDVQMALDLASNPVLQAFGVGVAVAAPVVAALVVAAIMHMLGTILGGQQTFTQMFTVTSWARLPLVFGNVLLTVQHLLGRWDPNPRGLSGLVACDQLAATTDCVTSFAQPLLGEIEVWNLWYLGLLGVAVWAASRVSGRKAVIAVLLFEGLRLAFGLTGVAVSRLLAGFAG